MTPFGYAERPCYPELVAICLAGGAHVLVEVSLSSALATLYNVGASLAFVGYCAWRARSASGAIRAWGLRRDNFWPALRAQIGFAVAAAAAMLVYGASAGSLRLPWTFWLTVPLYPVWGLAQQFALQNLIARNLAGLVSRPLGLAGASAALFAASHAPRGKLVLLTLVAGFFLTWIYRRHPNLWAVGAVHGWLGSLAFYLVLREDPGASIWRFLTRS